MPGRPAVFLPEANHPRTSFARQVGPAGVRSAGSGKSSRLTHRWTACLVTCATRDARLGEELFVAIGHRDVEEVGTCGGGLAVSEILEVPGRRELAQQHDRIAELAPTLGERPPLSESARHRRARTHPHARRRAEQAKEEASGVLRASIRELTQRENLSTRDIAALLELSPSRVDQLKPRRPSGTVENGVRTSGRAPAGAPGRRAPRGPPWPSDAK